MTCPNCGREFASDNGEKYCPYCAAPVKNGRHRVTGWFKAALAGVAVLALVAALVFGIGLVAGKYLGVLPGSSGVTALAVAPREEGLLYPGDSVRLLPEFTPAVERTPHITWSSSDEAVASVDDRGNVTAVSAGEASITALLDNGVQANYEVKVGVRATEVRISQLPETIKVGSELKLEALVTPENADHDGVKWKSSDPSVLTVDEEGNLCAVSEGTARVSASVSGGAKQSAEVVVYKYESDLIAQFIQDNGEYDYEDMCMYYVLEMTADTDETGTTICKYTELIWYPDDESIALCTDVYEQTTSVYYEVVVVFERGNTRYADVFFQCSINSGSSLSHTVPLSEGGALEAKAGGRIALFDYTQGSKLRMDKYEGESGFRDTAYSLTESIAGYGLGVLRDQWNKLETPFSIAETFGLEKL